MRSFKPQQVSRAFVPFFYLALLAAAGPALAADGILEINQACVATGCFPGDDPGFPVTVAVSSSYILTSNLDVRGEPDPEHVTAIQITENVVKLDLNGFSIIGPTVCTGTPVTSCSPEGDGRGIDAFGIEKVTIRNGTIIGMGNVGLTVGLGPRIEDILVESCGNSGIHFASPGGMALNNISRRNGASGFWGGADSIFIGNVAQGNGQWGITGHNTLGYGLNNSSDNGDGAISAGIQIANNVCDGALCP